MMLIVLITTAATLAGHVADHADDAEDDLGQACDDAEHFDVREYCCANIFRRDNSNGHHSLCVLVPDYGDDDNTMMMRTSD